tara:strand:- start:214 stop:489 length:276 start_codon:yes stop_codon:yes gene_type:complete
MSELRLISSSVGAHYSGSIEKIQCIMNPLITTADQSGSLSNLKYGNYVYPSSEYVPKSEILTNVTIPTGTTLEGPFGGVKVVNGHFLIYKK